MKKKLVLLSILLLFVSGCSIKKLSTTDFVENMDIILSEDAKLANSYFDGYKYYVPSGMRFVNKDDYNALLLDKNGNNYYLYVDAIGYYHKSKNTYKVDKDAYYSEKLKYGKKNGYIEINEYDDDYFVEMVFNYCKIEVYTPKKYLVSTIDNICYLLRSVDFNKKILESLIGENVLDYKEESFNIFESQAENNKSVLKFEDWQNAEIENNGHIPDEDNFELNDMD